MDQPRGYSEKSQNNAPRGRDDLRAPQGVWRDRAAGGSDAGRPNKLRTIYVTDDSRFAPLLEQGNSPLHNLTVAEAAYLCRWFLVGGW
jgi:hypothetical protein